MKPLNPEVIRALTPIFLGSMGGAIGIAVLVSPSVDATKSSAGFGLAGTAIAGAAGLAQNNNKSEDSFSEMKVRGDVNVEAPDVQKHHD